MQFVEDPEGFDAIQVYHKGLLFADLSRCVGLKYFDAMGCQRDICQQIIDQKGDYVISLKGNQGTLHQDVRLYLNDTNNHELVNENCDKGHGRIEQRVAAV